MQNIEKIISPEITFNCQKHAQLRKEEIEKARADDLQNEIKTTKRLPKKQIEINIEAEVKVIKYN